MPLACCSKFWEISTQALKQHHWFLLGAFSVLTGFTLYLKMNGKHADTGSGKQQKQHTKDLEELGYFFKDQKLLKKGAEDEPFEFHVGSTHRENQRHYEELGNAITQYIYKLLEEEYDLTRTLLPVGDKPQTFVFESEDARKADKLLVLIHGSGAVRAGQWSRRIIINDNLDEGSQIPYVETAKKEEYGILVLNPNLNVGEAKEEDEKSGNRKGSSNKEIPIKGNKNPDEHVQYVWKHIIEDSKATQVFVVAHSYGGHAFFQLVKNNFSSVSSKVVAVALTDSVHMLPCTLPSHICQWVKERCVNWVSSNKPLDSELPCQRDGCRCCSAGTNEHERTSASAITSVFDFFKKRTKSIEHTGSHEEDSQESGRDKESNPTCASKKSCDKPQNESNDQKEEGKQIDETVGNNGVSTEDKEKDGSSSDVENGTTVETNKDLENSDGQGEKETVALKDANFTPKPSSGCSELQRDGDNADTQVANQGSSPAEDDNVDADLNREIVTKHENEL
uniref:cotranscriptional regulator ARB2A homolog isoform X2 n=1 Tax=Myxine glutinosa TaxID=7769 RepID=UPI0035900279